MPQRPKKEVREAILTAAAETFAAIGFQKATLAEIVDRAGTSIGNLYKYFPNKDELFHAFIPPEFAAEVTQRIRARVRALRAEADPFTLGPSHPYRRASEELIGFALRHRERLVFLLLRADGTRYARFAEDLVRLLVELALRHAREAHPDVVVTPGKKRALTRIYRAFFATLASILDEERRERALREAVALHTIYHLSGLRELFLRPESSGFSGETAR